MAQRQKIKKSDPYLLEVFEGKRSIQVRLKHNTIREYFSVLMVRLTASSKLRNENCS